MQIRLVVCGAMAALALFSSPALAQRDAAVSQVSPLAMGETFTIESKVLGEVRRINVYLPPAYTAAPGVQLPVLYMPDGGMAEDFLHVAGLVQVLTGNGTMRPFILIGIENTQRRRDLTGPTTIESDKKIAPQVGGSARFRQFIRTELMPAVGAKYRTTSETAIIGESLAGLFVVETFVLEPDLFSTYIAVDPSLWWNGGELLGRGARLVANAGTRSMTLYLASSSDDVSHLTRRLSQLLRRSAPATVKWQYQAMPAETHATIYHPAALNALRRLFPQTAAR